MSQGIQLKVVIDILTPKQCMMFQMLHGELLERSHKVLMTTRRYKEVDEIIEKRGIKATAVGRHGGKSLKMKVLESVNRIAGLVPIYEEFSPDLVVSFSSPEAARASFGLGIPHLCISDSPHAEAVMKLTIPLSDTLMTPWMIPKEAWTGYGITPDSIILYNALDPWAWLKDFEPNRGILDELGIDTGKPVITIRSAEIFAAYLLKSKREESAIKSLIRGLVELDQEAQIVVIPRYLEQASALRGSSDGEVIVPEKAVDGPSLLHFSDLFIGAGGTMSAEAAILGVPTISCYPGNPTLVELFLIEQGLNERETNLESLVERASELLVDPKNQREAQEARARHLIKDFEDPVKVIADEIERRA
jgi:predicted glycosyltransferase